MSGDMAERAYVQSMVEHHGAQVADTTASMRAEVDRLAEEWASTAHQEQLDHEQRMAQIRADQAAWFKNFVDGEAAEPAPSPDVASQGQVVDVSAGLPASLARPGPGQQPNPHDAELAEAERIRQLPMSAWAEERQRLIRASATNRGMF